MRTGPSYRCFLFFFLAELWTQLRMRGFVEQYVFLCPLRPPSPCLQVLRVEGQCGEYILLLSSSVSLSSLSLLRHSGWYRKLEQSATSTENQLILSAVGPSGDACRHIFSPNVKCLLQLSPPLSPGATSLLCMETLLRLTNDHIDHHHHRHHRHRHHHHHHHH